MQWARRIDFEKELSGDLQLVYERCGREVLFALLDRLAGMKLFIQLDESTLTEMQRRYVQAHPEYTAKELARVLDVTSAKIRRLRGSSDTAEGELH